MINWLTDPVQHTFMQNAYLAIIMVGIISGVTGVFVTLRGLAFMGDAISHAVFPGVVIAFLTGGNFLIGALIAAVIVSFLIGIVSQSSKLSNDTAIGVFFAGAFALGIALISAERTYTRDLNSFLLGSILGVGEDDLLLTGLVGLFVIAIVLLFRRELTTVAFDRTFARATGLSLWRYDQLFLIMLSLAIVISLQTVGNILVLAMLVTPAATARLLTDRLRVMIVISALIGAASGVLGLTFSYHAGIASGASVVLVATAVFLVAYLFAPKTGLATATVRRKLHYSHPEQDAFADDLGTAPSPALEPLVTTPVSRIVDRQPDAS
jgi:manganese/iron transport system permease protein